MSSLNWCCNEFIPKLELIIIIKFPQNSPCSFQSTFFNKKSMQEKKPSQGKSIVIYTFSHLLLNNSLDAWNFSRLERSTKTFDLYNKKRISISPDIRVIIKTLCCLQLIIESANEFKPEIHWASHHLKSGMGTIHSVDNFWGVFACFFCPTVVYG